ELLAGVPGKALQRELPDRLQHREPWLAGMPGEAHQVLVHERTQSLEKRDCALTIRDCLRRVQAPSPCEDTGTPEDDALFLTEQVMAPGDCAAQRLLPIREIAGASGQQRQRPVQARQERLRRE